jgi:hypothetical protein
VGIVLNVLERAGSMVSQLRGLGMLAMTRKYVLEKWVFGIQVLASDRFLEAWRGSFSAGGPTIVVPP